LKPGEASVSCNFAFSLFGAALNRFSLLDVALVVASGWRLASAPPSAATTLIEE
jgi:hypothetical protein